MAETRQKSLILILARELASNLTTPVFVVDPEGALVFYNEAAEGILGEPFEEAGELSREEWATRFAPEAPEGAPLAPEDLPLARALAEHTPGHARMRITGRDGTRRDIAVTAFPLLVGGDSFAGAMAIFWEAGGDEQPARRGDEEAREG